MANDIRDYCASHPLPKSHQKAGEKTAMKRNPVSAGWAWKPDEATKRALSRGSRKIAKAKREALNPETEESKMATKKASKKKATRKTTRKTTAKKGTAKKVAKKVATKKANGISLKELLGKKMDPKLARRKLRSEGMTGHDPKARWTFTPAQAKKAKAILGL